MQCCISRLYIISTCIRILTRPADNVYKIFQIVSTNTHDGRDNFSNYNVFFERGIYPSWKRFRFEKTMVVYVVEYG